MENKINKNIKIVNNIILTTTIIAIAIAGITTFFIPPTQLNNVNKIASIFIIIILGFMTFSGVWSVVMSNNKSPIGLLVLSSIATLFKLMYPIIEISTGQERVNSTVLIGQSISFFTLMIQVYFWIKWNKQQDDGKFITEMFKGKRTYIALSLIGTILLVEFGLSFYVNGGNPLYIMMDVINAGLYTIASILMAFGNVMCFAFFILSDLSWLYWTITDLMNTTSSLMFMMALLTTIEVSMYTLLAITGWVQWVNDNKIKKTLI